MKRFIVSTISASFAAAIGGPNAFKTMEVMCHENNFSFESYTAVTKDGYVLTIGRIPGKFTEVSSATVKPVVLFMHA